MKFTTIALSFSLVSLTAPGLAAAYEPKPLPPPEMPPPMEEPSIDALPPLETPPPIDAPPAAEPPPPQDAAPGAAAATPGKAAPWALALHFGLALPFGPDAAPAQGVRGPEVGVDMGFLGSYWYGYAAAGFSVLLFDDHNPLKQRVVSTKEGEYTAESSASTATGWVEIGGMYTFSIGLGKDTFIELVPSVGYGLLGVAPLTRSVSDCIDCASEEIGVDYQGGQYARFTLGAFWASGKETRGRFGLTTSYQRFLTPGAASLTDQLTFWMTIGAGRVR